MEREQGMIRDNRQLKKACTSRAVATVTGLKLCAEASYPDLAVNTGAPYFPLTGAVSAGIYLYKTDVHTSYELSLKSFHVSLTYKFLTLYFWIAPLQV